MSNFNDKLQNLSLLKLIIVGIVVFLASAIVDRTFLLTFILLIAYILFETRHEFDGLKSDLKSIFSKFSITKAILLVVAFIILSIGCNIFIEYIVSIMPYLDYSNTVTGSGDAQFNLEFYLLMITALVAAPIFEEFLFRGIIFSKLNKKLPLIAAILISSLIFSLLHGFHGIIDKTLFAICLCLIYVKTENIFTCVTMHLLYNVLSTVILLIIPLDMLSKGTNSYIIYVISLIIIIFILKFIKNEYDEVKSLNK